MNEKQSLSAWGSAETKYFYELTPERILEAVENFGFRCTGRCFALNSMENRVYEVEIEVDDEKLPRNSPERFRIVKFYRPGRWTKEQILEEHQFLLDLVELDIPVIAPVALNLGETLQQAPACSIWCAVFPKAGGRNPDELLDDQLPLVGRLLARLHNAGAVKTAKHRVRISTETYGRESLRYLLEEEILPACIAQPYADAVNEICDISAPWFETAEVQRIHGDCHLGNLVWGEAGPFWVDFDDMLQGPCVQDLWLLIPGRDDFAREQFNTLLSAYEQMRDFDERSLRLIEPLRTLRLVHFNAWISKRWGDPSFPRTFVEFGTERYWNEQLQQVDEQLQLVRQARDFSSGNFL